MTLKEIEKIWKQVPNVRFWVPDYHYYPLYIRDNTCYWTDWEGKEHIYLDVRDDSVPKNGCKDPVYNWCVVTSFKSRRDFEQESSYIKACEVLGIS